MKAKVTLTIEIEIEAENLNGIEVQSQKMVDQIESTFNAVVTDANLDIDFGDEATIDDKIACVQSDYHNDEKEYTSIDVWLIGDEDGKVAAHVYDNGFVEWVSTEFMDSTIVRDEIESVKKDLGNE